LTVKLITAIVAATLTLVALPASAVEEDSYPEYTGPEFQALYEYAVANTLPNLDPPSGRYTITGDEALDERIWQRAFDRGYVLVPTASGELSRVGGVPMQPQAADAWIGLRAEARNAGMGFIVSSAYRSPASQRTKFRSKLGGTSDNAIDAALTWWSIPGTSKHHAGYALDFRYTNGTFGEFRETPDYVWLSGNNFAIPKRHGLIPSFPDDGVSQGPNPEPWEFVWVGTSLISCGIPQSLTSLVTGPAAAIVAEIEACPGGAQPATLPEWLVA
jgi:D-alanyl-D-alanine carboxypeptidase-like protein